MFLAAFVSFVSFWVVLHQLPPSLVRKLVGYKTFMNVLLHGSVLWMFIGTSTEGLLQAEAAAIMFSIWVEAYRRLQGYERLVRIGWKFSWVRYPARVGNKSRVVATT